MQDRLRALTLALFRYYTISTILGTVALAYGSVPLYKMVRPGSYGPSYEVRGTD